MIDTHVYQLQAELPSTKLDENGRQIIEWQTIYAQVNKDTLEYSLNKKSAFYGDYDDAISKWKISYQEKDDESIVKLTQETKKKSSQPKILLIKEDEGFPNDFQKVCNSIRDSGLDKKSIGRPILVNSHTGRGVSALSRNAENQSYRGLVNILIIWLVFSNAQNILRLLNDQGWIFGKVLIDALADSSNFQLKNLKYFLYAQHLVS